MSLSLDTDIQKKKKLQNLLDHSRVVYSKENSVKKFRKKNIIRVHFEGLAAAFFSLHLHRSSTGTSFNACSIWFPQPFHVGLPHVSQVVFIHILEF